MRLLARGGRSKGPPQAIAKRAYGGCCCRPVHLCTLMAFNLGPYVIPLSSPCEAPFLLSLGGLALPLVAQIGQATGARLG